MLRWRDVAAAAIACLLVACAVNNLVQANRAIGSVAPPRDGDHLRKLGGAMSRLSPSNEATVVLGTRGNSSGASSGATNQPTRRSSKLRLPNVLLIGAQKGGSSALAAWLFDQGVCRPKAFPGEPKSRNKEVHFFDNAQRYEKGAEFYARRFEHCDGKTLIMDATPDYLPFPHRVKQTYERVGDDHDENLKVIMILREPVARELSLYNHKAKFYRDQNVARISFWGDVVRNDGQLMSFGQYMNRTVLRGVDPTTGTCKMPPQSYWWCFSVYSPPLLRWIHLFDASQVLLLSHDEMVHDEETFRGRVRSFLGMGGSTSDELLLSAAKIKPSNVQHSEHKLALPPCRVQSKLSVAFRRANEHLYELLRTKTEPAMEQRPFPTFILSNCSDDEGATKTQMLDTI